MCKRDYFDIGLALSGEIMTSAATIEYIQKLIVDLNLPRNLAAVGAKEADFESLADDALRDYCLVTTPRTVSKAQIVQIYQHAFERWRVSK